MNNRGLSLMDASQSNYCALVMLERVSLFRLYAHVSAYLQLQGHL